MGRMQRKYIKRLWVRVTYIVMGIMSYRRCLDTNIFWVMGVDDILGGGFEGHIHT